MYRLSGVEQRDLYAVGTWTRWIRTDHFCPRDLRIATQANGNAGEKGRIHDVDQKFPGGFTSGGLLRP